MSKLPHSAEEDGRAQAMEGVDWNRLSIGRFVAVVALITALLSCLSIALHSPGQISMDTSVQLYEALLGQSISYNPPFMSALLQWLGGGNVATSLMLLINTLLLYGSFVLVTFSVAQMRGQQEVYTLSLWRGALAVIVLLNPIVFLYAGILWKDVLFSSLLTSGGALAIAASVGSVMRRYACAVFALLLLAAAFITRQQGVFMVPFMVLAVIAALWSLHSKRQVYLVVAVIGIFLACVFVLERQIDRAIKPPAVAAQSVGLHNLMIFDLAGMLSESTRDAREHEVAVSEEQLKHIRAVYTPERVDTLEYDSVVREWMNGLKREHIATSWGSMILQNPQAYLSHRFSSFAWLMGLEGVEGTLPIHVGIEGNEAYLERVGLQSGQTQRSHLIYQMATPLYSTPLFRHVFWFATLLVVAVYCFYARLPRPLLVISGSISVATLLMYASFLPAGVAADFRYLFGAIPLIMLLALVGLLGSAQRKT
jgi:hypothetical protein